MNIKFCHTNSTAGIKNSLFQNITWMHRGDWHHESCSDHFSYQVELDTEWF